MAFGGFEQGASGAPMADINTTPLVDVMLVLLIIFMITAPLLTHAVKIDIPEASSQPAEEQPDTVTLSLDGEGALYWNDEPVAAEALPERLAATAIRTPQPELHLRADRETRYQRLADVMASARNAGIRRIGFVTLPGAEPAVTPVPDVPAGVAPRP
ncbi:MAG: biopolymer transporter ExbD [Rhodocyclaceae bacterium]|nr:biopolymer transporter ExbD [Rhodocyclaceae bacterium]